MIGASAADIKLSDAMAVKGTDAVSPCDKSKFAKYFSGDAKRISDGELEALLGRPISYKHWGGTVGSEVWLQPDISVSLFGVDFNLAIIGKAIFTDENGLVIGGLAMIIIFAVDNKILAPDVGKI